MTTWMIVEDEPDIYETMLAVFEMWGVEGLGFIDGEETIKWINDVDTGQYTGELPELAVLDIRLPGSIDGIMIGKRLRESPKLRHVAIVISTAYKLTVEEDLRLIKESGADKFIHKPLPKFKELAEIFQDVIVQRKSSPKQSENILELRNNQNYFHILVIDDEHALLYFVSKALWADGYLVTTLSSGEEALQFLSDQTDNLPDVILTDIRMPGISGFDLLRKVKAEPRWSHIPVLLMTGYPEKIHEELQQLAIAGYLIKPFSDQELQETVSLSTTKVVPPKSESTSLVSSNQKIEVILVIEDERHVLKNTLDILTMEGFEVHGAENGRLGFDLALKYHPDMVICDIAMPEMNGYEVLAAIRGEPKLRHIQFVFLTARQESRDIGLAIELGVDDYIIKPFSVADLLSSIDSCTQNQFTSYSRSGTLSSPARKRTLFVIDNGSVDSLKYKKALKDTDVAHSSISNLRKKVAVYGPTAIVLLTREYTCALQTLREFELSKYVPTITVTKEAELVRYNKDLAWADEVCVPEVDYVLAAIDKVEEQYHFPALIETGNPWEILIISRDTTLSDKITVDLATNYYVKITNVESLDNLQLGRPLDLLVLDTTTVANNQVEPVVKKLNQEIDVPIILLAPQGILTLQQQFEYGVQAIWTRPISREHITITIERLLRYIRKPKPLIEIWAQYHILLAEADYESWLRHDRPHLATVMQEVGALYSGLIHDLRNSIYVLNSQIVMLQKRLKLSMSDTAILQESISYSDLLLEQVANGRFKASWNPKLRGGDTLVKVVEKAITLGQQSCPFANFRLKSKIETTRSQLLIDETQVTTAVASVLATLIGNRHSTVIITLKDNKQNFEIVICPGRWKAKTVQRFLSPDQFQSIRKKKMDLALLTATRLITRHQGNIKPQENTIIITLPKGDWNNEELLRQDIGQIADEYEDKKRNAPKIHPHDVDINVSPLITSTAVKLVESFSRIVRLTSELGEAGKRIQITSRFGLLLASNLLVTSAGYKPQPQPLNLELIFANLYQLREDKLKNCKVNVEIELDTPSVLADELGLMQVLINLVSNALEAMSGAGEIFLKTGPHPEGVQIIISDTGRGIPPEHLNRIFELFYTTKQGQERGVGLHIVASIIQKLGGQLNVESMIGKGTTFTIILPAASSA